MFAWRVSNYVILWYKKKKRYKDLSLEAEGGVTPTALNPGLVHFSRRKKIKDKKSQNCRKFVTKKRDLGRIWATFLNSAISEYFQTFIPIFAYVTPSYLVGIATQQPEANY